MATIYRNKKTKIFETDIYINGRKFHRTTGCTTRREAAQEVKRLEAELRDSVKIAGAANASLRLDDVAGRYMADIGDNHAGSDNTNRLNGYLIEHFGTDKWITDITHDDVASLIRWRRKHRVGKKSDAPFISPFTVNDTTEQLKKLFTYCKQRSVRFPNEPRWKDPALWLDEPPERERELTEDETKRLMDAVATVRPDYAPLFEFAWASGKRKTECFTLEWPHVKWQEGIIERRGKGKKMVRVDITPSIRAILMPLRGHHPIRVFTFVAERTVRNKVIRGKRYDFVKGQRYPLTKEGLRRVWRAVRLAAGIPLSGENRFRFHDLRHDFATKLMRSVEDASGLKVVQKALDHAALTTTLRYAHVRREDVAAHVEAVTEARNQKRDQNHPTNHPTKILKLKK